MVNGIVTAPRGRALLRSFRDYGFKSARVARRKIRRESQRRDARDESAGSSPRSSSVHERLQSAQRACATSVPWPLPFASRALMLLITARTRLIFTRARDGSLSAARFFSIYSVRFTPHRPPGTTRVITGRTVRVAHHTVTRTRVRGGPHRRQDKVQALTTKRRATAFRPLYARDE